jgi:hypothetical protein
VCRAKDTKLDRDVAIKIQPASIAKGAFGFWRFPAPTSYSLRSRRCI